MLVGAGDELGTIQVVVGACRALLYFGPWLPIERAGVALLIHQLDYDLRLV